LYAEPYSLFPGTEVFTFLLVLLIIDALVLATVVLLQAGKGGGLAAMGGGAGTDTLFGGRHATTLLTRLSWWCGGAFIALAYALSILSSRPPSADSILQREFQRGQPTAPAAVPPVQAPAGDAAQPGAAAPAEAAPTAPLQPQSATNP
jgi:preprotein translocase subunit SecG